MVEARKSTDIGMKRGRILSNLPHGRLYPRGLDIVSSVWSQIDFEGDKQWSDIKRLTYDMLLGLKKRA